MSTLTWITEIARAKDKKQRRPISLKEKDQKFHSSGENMKNTRG